MSCEKIRDWPEEEEETNENADDERTYGDFSFLVQFLRILNRSYLSLLLNRILLRIALSFNLLSPIDDAYEFSNFPSNHSNPC